MILLLGYKTVAELKMCIGEPLSYKEVGFYTSNYKHTGSFVASHRPSLIQGEGEDFFVRITMKDGLIELVEGEL
jgi:hypothetical protein